MKPVTAVAVAMVLLSAVAPASAQEKAEKAKRQAAVSTRIERDLLGEKNVPASAYYGVQTARALENFQISNAPTGQSTPTASARKSRARRSARCLRHTSDPTKTAISAGAVSIGSKPAKKPDGPSIG